MQPPQTAVSYTHLGTGRAASVLCRGSDVEGVTGGAVSHYLCQDIGSSCLCVFQGLQNYNAGSLTHNKSISVLVKGDGCPCLLYTSGLYRIEFEENGKTIRSAEEIEDVDELPDEDEDGVFVYYFGDSPKEGAMKTGTMTMEIDGDKYYYSFEKSGSKRGAGTDGIDGDSIYVKGRRLEAEEGTKYQPVTYKDETYRILSLIHIYLRPLRYHADTSGPA